MNQKRLVIVQAASEAVIPVIALFMLDWGTYFILLYYFLDLIISEVVVHFKIKKILRYRKGHSFYKTELKRATIISLFAVIAFIILCHIALNRYDQTFYFYKEFIGFLQYKELGVPIPQWVLLVPILILASYQQYQLFFIQRGQFKVLLPQQLLEARLKQNVILVLLAAVCIPIIAFTQLDDLLLILLVIIGKLVYDLRSIIKR